MKGWTRGVVHVSRVSCGTILPEQRHGLVRGPWGIFRAPGFAWNARGEPLHWNLTHTLSGRLVTFCRTPSIAAAVAADLDAIDIDWAAVTTDVEAYGGLDAQAGARRIAVVLARWGSEGDIRLTDRIRRHACSAAGLPVVEGAA